jgi:hypothetical protein
MISSHSVNRKHQKQLTKMNMPFLKGNKPMKIFQCEKVCEGFATAAPAIVPS